MSIYDQHKAHTARVRASAILRKGEHVANITIIYPSSGSLRLHAYAHWLGTTMVRGHAGGGGYDKSSAALSAAADARWGGLDKARASVAECMFWEYLRKNDGQCWDDALAAAGFTVLTVC